MDLNPDFFALWTYLAATPLVGLTLTLVAYTVGDYCYRRAKLNPLVNPVLIAVALIAVTLWLLNMDYATYFDGAQFVHFLLGPATVALAVPLYQCLNSVRQTLPAAIPTLALGSLAAIALGVGPAWLLNAEPQLIGSLAPKSTTTPVAMWTAEQLGGLPELTAVLVIITGIVGATLGPPLLNTLGIRDWRARGLAIGIAAHGIGTARAFTVNPTAGAFASLGLCLNAPLTALALTLSGRWIG